ncbi:hypothetical protein QJS10_CPB15g01196 [Acorus calamus]|uniref:Uncharacterized protein n=1 Tax=Acorus calamus TaxID=4465 RepID=A0AAV9D943_ACOCL|nr:hypothetical protein QJS10_CPB15g01196 [Acorus calamus]
MWREIPIEYDWKPTPCKKCSTFGHLEAQCSDQGDPQAQSGKKTTQHYVPVTRNVKVGASQDAHHLLSSTQSVSPLEEAPQAEVLLEDALIVKAAVESAIQESNGLGEVVV